MHITHRQLLHNGHYKLSQLIVQDGVKELRRERFEPGQAVAALVFDTHRQEYILVRQYRVGAEDEVLEIPAGVLDHEGEAPDEAMRREIMEEIGYEVDKLNLIAGFYPSPGNSAEFIHLYYAEVSRQTAAGGGAAAENEKIEIIRLPLDKLLQQPIQDGKTWMAIQWAQLHSGNSQQV
ncbi:NUDIX domain-containing protein [Hymenobacter sp. DG25A]|uniref:NUDIX domain-containing protein n=1 Tax=Hymenobacter sp. DG25A TaxID=1385663 RepID=UPI0006BC2773|nr:NUDIX hydrolase [Hymenobacter sp. DG25A]ALD20787.1 hypothetical protein AM218_05575 [Hymenobacter sp. DG25A]